MLWSRIAVESERCRTTTRPAPVRWTRRQHGADSRSPRQDPPDTWPRSQLTRCRSHWRPSPTSGGGRSLAPNAALSSLRRVEAGILAVTVTTPGSSERHARRLTAAQIPEDFGESRERANPYMLWSRIAVESERCRTTTRPAPVRWTRRQHGADSRSPRQDPPDTWPRSQLTRCRSHWRPSPTSGGGRSLAPNAALSSLRRVEAGILAVTVTTPGSSERHARRLTAAQIPEDFGESRERANHYMLGSPE